MNSKRFVIIGHTQLGGPCVIDFCNNPEDAAISLEHFSRRSRVRKVELYERIAKKNLPTRERPRRAIHRPLLGESDTCIG